MTFYQGVSFFFAPLAGWLASSMASEIVDGCTDGPLAAALDDPQLCAGSVAVNISLPSLYMAGQGEPIQGIIKIPA